MALTFT